LWTLLASLECLDVVRVYGRPEEAGAEALRAVREYATTPECRRRAHLGYFGDDTPTCGGCDVCEDSGVGTAFMGRGVSPASSSTGRRLA
jgi:superfamily II DNA helicase RecQ